MGGDDVRVMKKEVVGAILPMQEHLLPLSNLDLLLPPVDFGVLFCYRNPSATLFGSMVSTLKKALAQTLVSYYPLAGELVSNSAGEPQILCNNRGVDFMEAVSDLELQQLDFHNPDLSFEGKLVPHKKQGLLSVQATELKCGGIVVACTFDHRIADAFSANMFLVSWAEMARSPDPKHFVVPTFRRSLLNPGPGRLPFDPSIEDMYVPISSLPPPAHQHQHRLLASRIYYVSSNHLNDLQSHNTRRSKLESLSAFLWQLVAKYEYQNKNTYDDQMVASLGIVVDGRSRLSDGEMGRYFGNVLSIPYGGRRVGELQGERVGLVAEEVHRFLEGAGTGDHFQGLVDMVEGRRPEGMLARIYANSGGPALVVSSGQRFPAARVDFGWGGPALGSYHFPWGGTAGYVMPMPSPLGNGDWLVYMHLFQEHLTFIDSHASHFFRPLTWDYLNQ